MYRLGLGNESTEQALLQIICRARHPIGLNKGATIHAFSFLAGLKKWVPVLCSPMTMQCPLASIFFAKASMSSILHAVSCNRTPTPCLA